MSLEASSRAVVRKLRYSSALPKYALERRLEVAHLVLAAHRRGQVRRQLLRLLPPIIPGPARE